MRKARKTVTRSAERNPFGIAEPNSPIAAHNADPVHGRGPLPVTGAEVAAAPLPGSIAATSRSSEDGVECGMGNSTDHGRGVPH